MCRRDGVGLKAHARRWGHCVTLHLAHESTALLSAKSHNDHVLVRELAVGEESIQSTSV